MLDSPDPRIALSWAIADIHGKGWATGTGGNFSLVLGRDPLTLLMAPSGVDKGLVKPEDLIEVNAQQEVLRGNGIASAETTLHLAIATFTGAGSILHTHSIFNTLLSDRYQQEGKISFVGQEMLKGLSGVNTHDITVDLLILPNSQNMNEVAENFQALIQAQASFIPGILLAGHGLYAWGKDLFSARRHLEILEFLLELTYYRQLLA